MAGTGFHPFEHLFDNTGIKEMRKHRQTSYGCFLDITGYCSRSITCLRTLLCNNQTKWEMKILDPYSNLSRKEIFRGDVPNRPLLTSLLHCCHGSINCLLAPQTPILNSEAVLKSAKCKAPFLQSFNTLQLLTSTKVKTFIPLCKTICGFWFYYL